MRQCDVVWTAENKHTYYVLHDMWVGRHYGDTKQWNSCTAFEQNKAIMLRTKQCPYILP